MIRTNSERTKNRLSGLHLRVLGKYQYVVLALSLYISVASYWDVLPGIFQDEYVYSMGARKLPLEEQTYPNYLFAWIFQTTNFCGADFYTCAKGINTFLLGLLLVFFYLLSRLVLNRKNAVLLTAVAALSPVTIFASFFMPEILFFTLNLVAIYLIVRLSDTKTLWPWIFVIAVLGLALLTKRHELFLLPGYAVAIFLSMRLRRFSTFFSIASAFFIGLAGPVLLRQLVVYFITGKPWVGLLGQTYERSFRESLDNPNNPGGDGEVLGLLSQGLWHGILHLGVLTILGLGLIIWKGPVRAGEPNSFVENQNGQVVLRWIAIALTFSIIPIVIFFESFLTQSGDSHALRLLARYYEFIFLILLILSTQILKSDFIIGNKKRLIATFVFGYLVFVGLIGPFIKSGPADSPTIHGLRLMGPIIFLFFGFILFALLDKKPSREKMRVLGLSLIIPILILTSGIMARIDLRATIGTEYSYFDIAGLYFKDSFPQVDGSSVLVIGKSRTEIVATKFGIDQPNIRHSIQPTKPVKILNKKLKGIKYVLTLYPTSFITDLPVTLVHEAKGFRIFRID